MHEKEIYLYCTETRNPAYTFRKQDSTPFGKCRCCRVVCVREVAGSDLTLAALPGTTKGTRPVISFDKACINNKEALTVLRTKASSLR